MVLSVVHEVLHAPLISKDIQWPESLRSHAFKSMHFNLGVCCREFLGACNELKTLTGQHTQGRTGHDSRPEGLVES